MVPGNDYFLHNFDVKIKVELGSFFSSEFSSQKFSARTGLSSIENSYLFLYGCIACDKELNSKSKYIQLKFLGKSEHVKNVMAITDFY